MVPQITTSVRFKRDYVAAAAVAIFFFIVTSEIALAVVIPVMLGRASIYAEQEARQRMLDGFDAARALCYTPHPDPVAAGEISLVHWNLDSLAIYLRKNAANMSGPEISEMASDIAEFSLILQHIRKNGAYCAPAELNIDAYLKAAGNAPQEKNGN